MQNNIPPYHVGWISTVRYTQPLNLTEDKKWQRLCAELPATIHVMAFSSRLRPQRITQHAHFYLLPLLPLAPLRYALVFLVAPLFVWWFMWRHGVQVFIAQSPYEGAITAWAIAVARLFGKEARVVVEAHNDFENNLFTLRKVTFASAYRWFMARVSRYGLRRADALRAVSRITEAQFRQLAPDKPLVRFMGWTDIGAFSAVVRTIPLTAATTVVYVGVITQLKGIHHLLEAFAPLPADTQLLLIGAEEQPLYAQHLREQIRTLRIESRVVWYGKLSQTELAHRLVNARCLVLPSQSEGLPRVIIEAMTCGTPVIASRVGGIPDVIEDGKNGLLVTAGDVSALQEALQHVFRADEATLAHLVEQAQHTAHATFSPEAYILGYRTVIRLALGLPLESPTQ